MKNARISKTGLLLFAAVPLLFCRILPAEEAEKAHQEEAEETEESSIYTENEWNFVDISMDVSNGIPADSRGRLMEIREKGRLTVATEPYYAPQEFIDPTLSGQESYVGADMEMARLIAEKMGVELEIIPLDFTEVLSSVTEGKYDLAISGLAFTPGRTAVMEMSKGYHISEGGVISGLLIHERNKNGIRTLEDLKGLDIIAQSGSLQESLSAENIPDYHEFRRVSSIQMVYQALESGDAAASVVNVENAEIYIENNPDCGLMLVPGIRFEMPDQYLGDRVAAFKGETDLIAFVNGVIDELLASGQYAQWFEEYSDYARKLGL